MIEEVGFDVVGQRIRRVRTARGLTIRELAERAEVSKNTLLRLEKGQGTHVSTIRQIAKALKLTPQQIAGKEFQQPSVVAIHRNTDHVWFDMNSFVTVTQPPLRPEELSNPAVTPFSLIRSRLNDGVFNPNLVILRHPTPERSHRGYEFLFVLDGTVRVHVNLESYVLEKGESICFWAAEPHRYEPAEQGIPAQVLSIVIDPFPGPEPPPPIPLPASD